MDFNNDTGTLGNVAIISPIGDTVTFSGTGGMTPISGTTAQRPAGAPLGTYRYNSEINDIEMWNGTSWATLAGSNSVIAFTISTWFSAGGGLYYADIIHNMGTRDLGVTLWNTVNNSVVHADSIVATSTSTLRVTVTDNLAVLRCIVVSAGTFVGYNVANTVIRTLTYYAASLDSPNNSDWALNSLAAAVTDPINSSLTVRQFSNTVEQGVGFYITVPAGATNVTFRFKGRPQVTPGAAAVVQPKLYVRNLPNNAAITTWQAAVAMTNITIPTNNFIQYSSQTYALGALGFAVGGLYQCEMTRSTTVSGGTNLASNWNLIELTIEFT